MERLDRAALRAGASLDTVGAGSDVQRMENLDRSVQRLSRDMGGGGGGGGRGGLNGILGIFANRWTLIGGGVAAALPFLTQASGAVLTLVGSLVQAAGGAGVIGGGALGAFAVGIGSVMAVSKGLTEEIGNASKAYEQYTTTVQQYGAASTQAATAQRNLNTALHDAPRGTRALVIGISQLSEAWKDATASSRAYLVQQASQVVGQVRGVLPQVGGIVNQNVMAAGGAARGILNRLLSPDSLRILAQVSTTFRRDLPPAADAVANLALSFGRLTAAAGPFVNQFLVRFDQWTQRLDLSTRDTAYLRFEMQGLVTEFNHWLNVLLAAGRFLNVLFQAATNTHQALGGITGQLDRWTEWMRDNPVRMQRFFNESGQAVHDLGAVLGWVVRLLTQMSSGPLWASVRNVIAQFAQPLSQLLIQIVQLITTLSSGLGPLGGTLGITMRLLSGVLGLINSILQAIPGLGFVVAGALTALGIYKMVSAFGQFVGLIPRAGSEMAGLTSQTNAAAAATERLAAASRGVGGGIPFRAGASTAGAAAAAEAGMYARGAPGLVGRLRGGVSGIVGGVLGRPGGARFAVGPGGEVVERGMLARLGGVGGRMLSGRLGAVGGLAGGAGLAASVGLMLASSMAPQGGRLGGALRGASIGSLAMMTGQPEIGIPAMAIGALVGALTAHGPDRTQSYLARQLTGWTEDRVLNQRLLNQGAPGGEVMIHHAGLSGLDPHTSDQIRDALNRYRRVLQNTAGSTNASVVQARQQMMQQVLAMRQVLPQTRARERHAAFMGAGELGQAFNIVAPQQGAAAGMHFVLGQALQQWGSLTTAGRRMLGQQLLDWAAEMRRQNPALEGQFEEIRKSVIGKFLSIHGHIVEVNGKVVADVKGKWRQIGQELTDPVERAREAVSRNLTAIQQQAISVLSQMGYTPGQARSIMNYVSHGGHMGDVLSPGALRDRAAQYRGRATGGRIPGVGLQDTVPIGGAMAAPGELIVNRHTERHVDQMLASHGASLGGMVASENRPHHMYATGGRYHGYPMPHKAVRQVADSILRHFPGLSVSSTTGGGHAAGSYHYMGEAVDLAAPMTRSGMGLMNRAAAWTGANFMRALTEGIHNPNLSVLQGARIRDSYWGSGTWGSHKDHIHVAVLDAGHGGSRLQPSGAAPAGQRRAAVGDTGVYGRAGRAAHRYMLSMADLLSGSTTVPGLPGTLVDTTGLEVSAATLSRMNRILAGAGGGGAGVSHAAAHAAGVGTSGGMGTSGSNQALAKQMMMSIWGAGQWPYLRQLWTQESGFRTTAKNPSSGAYGIPQSLPASKMAAAGADFLTNPATQIKWGLGYIHGRYGSPREAWAHEQTHNWYGEGGDFIARKPRTIGVGDRPERVSITPLSGGGAHGGRGGPMHVTVHIEHIDATGAPGKIREQVRGEIRDALADVADELDRTGNVPEESIL